MDIIELGRLAVNANRATRNMQCSCVPHVRAKGHSLGCKMPELERAVFDLCKPLIDMYIEALNDRASDRSDQIIFTGIHFNGVPMPKNSKVGKCYDKLVSKGKSKGSAAAICQSSTGQSLKTGRKPKKRK